MKNLGKRFSMIFMCLLLVFTTIDYNSFLSKADDVKWVDSDTNYLSFGTVGKYDSINYQIVDIYNFNNEALDLIWYTSDPDNMLAVDAPDTLHLEPNERTQFWVTCNTYMSAGTYYSQLYITDKSDPSCMYGVCVNASVTIKESNPYITSVTVSPKNISLTRNSTVNFSANVSGGNNYSGDVAWQIIGSNGSSEIDRNGKLSIGSNESATTLVVRAISKTDGNYYDEAKVSITKNTYAITVSASPSNAGAVSGGGTVNQGDNITLVASPYSGYQFVRWKKGDNEVGTSTKLSVKSINANANYVAEFKQVNCKVHVTSNHSYGGSTSGDVNVGYGGETTITATANPGYKFDGWYEGNNKVSSDAKYKITNITSDRTFTAAFNQCQYSVAAQVSPQEGGSVSGTGKYNQGDTVRLKATPNNGYIFSGWFLNGNEYSKNTEIAIDNIGNDYSFIAYFMKQGITTYNIGSSTFSSDGTISPEGNYAVPQGANVTYAITPKSGFVVSDVKVDNISVGAVGSYTFTSVSGSHSIVAYFAKKPEEPKKETHQEPAGTPTNDNTSQANNNPANTNGNQDNNSTNGNSSQNNDGNTTNNYEIVPSNNTKVDNSSDYSREAIDYNLDDETGLMQEYNVSDSQVIEKIRNGYGKEMFEKAIDYGSFELSIYNELGSNAGVVQDMADADVSVTNASAVISGMLTDEDLLDILHTKKVAISINLYDNTNSISDEDRRLINNTLFGAMRVYKYFDVVILKTVDGDTQEINKLNVPMTMVIDVPDEFRGANKSFYIIRSHTEEDGVTSTDFLTDEDSNPDTITFSSDKFSSYALVYVGENNKNWTASGSSQSTTQYTQTKSKDKTTGLGILIGCLVGLILTLGVVNLIVAGSRRKKRKK